MSKHLPARKALLGVSTCLLAVWGLWGDEGPGTQAQAPDPRVEIVPRSTTLGTPTESAPRVDLRVDTTLVLIPVTVTDPMNRFVTGLDREHFKLQEDNVDQAITHFASEDAPLSVGVVFDTSGSMGSKLQKSRQAVAQFCKTANPKDEFFLVQFNSAPQLTVPFTFDIEEIQNRITFTQSRGRTALAGRHLPGVA